ncbi:hypothetical protein IFVP5_C2280275 [Vibrio parahaemolyticus]
MTFTFLMDYLPLKRDLHHHLMKSIIIYKTRQILTLQLHKTSRSRIRFLFLIKLKFAT